MFEIDPTRRYDIPVVFGPSLLPDVSTYGEIRTIDIPFRTTREALSRYVPGFFQLPDNPVVSVSSVNMFNVDFLGGRGYNITQVSTMVTYDGSEHITAPYHLVIWETDSKPVIAGREFQGYAKIVGRTPLHERSDAVAAFECFEYDEHRLLRGEVRNLEPVPEADLSRLNQGGPNVALGWKYIPSPDGGADVSYPTKTVMYGTVTAMWRGTGSITFDCPTWQQAPSSSRIIAAIRDLPNLGYRTARVTHAKDGRLPRNEVRRLR